MKFFGSSLDIRDNLKVAFFGKILSNMSWHLPQKRIAPLLYLVINMTDWLSRVFVEIAVSLSNNSRERSINSTERQAQGEVQHATKISQGDLSSTQLVSAKFTERQAHRPQLKFLAQTVLQHTVTQAWQLHKVWTSYQIYTWISWFFPKLVLL